MKNQPVELPSRPFKSTAQPNPSFISMSELIAKAHQAKERPAAEEAMEIQQCRMEARRKVEEMVATVEFNDPFIDFMDVFMSRQQLLEAREAASGAEARIVVMAHGREMEALNGR
jgi:hypothetical protein